MFFNSILNLPIPLKIKQNYLVLLWHDRITGCFYSENQWELPDLVCHRQNILSTSASLPESSSPARPPGNRTIRARALNLTIGPHKPGEKATQLIAQVK